MKNILKRTLPFVYLLAVGLMVSCDRTEIEVLDPGNGFVQINNTSGQIGEESADPAVIDILFGGSSNENGITVKYTIESDDASRYNDISGGSVTIPAGEFSTQILIQPIDNETADGNAALNVILSSESSVAVGIGGGANNAAKLLTIVDNDCPIIFENMTGKYKGTDNWVQGALETSFDASYDGTSFKVKGLGYAWLSNPGYWGEPIITDSEVEINIDPLTGEIEIPYTYTGTTTYLGAPYDYYVEGSGKYSACNDSFELEFVLYYDGKDPVGGYFGIPDFVWKETLTR